MTKFPLNYRRLARAFVSAAFATITVTTGFAAPPESLSPDVPAAREAQALEVRSSKRQEIILNGLWHFQPGTKAAGPVAVAEAWGWHWVPGSWSHSSPWPSSHLPSLAVAGNGAPWTDVEFKSLAQGWYERRVNVPANWIGRRIELDLQRVSTDAHVWLNDKDCGKLAWPGGTLDVTAAVVAGENRLRVEVVALGEGQTLDLMGVGENQMNTKKAEIWNRGITGDVILSCRPAGAAVSDVFVQTSTRKNTVTLDVEVSGVTQAGTVTFTARMLDKDGKAEKTFTATSEVKAANQQRVVVSWPWADARRWDLDKPELYTLQLVAQGADLDDEYQQTFGFREFWIGDGSEPQGPGQVNGKQRFWLNGVEFRPRPTTADDGVWDCNIMMPEAVAGYFKSLREIGFNMLEVWPQPKIAKRGTLDFQGPLWYDIADRMGLPLCGAGPESIPFVIDTAYRPTWNPARQADYERYAEAMLRRLRNHPSILIYATNANFYGHRQDQNPRYIGRRGWAEEPPQSPYHARQKGGAEALAFIKKTDPTRPVFTHMGGQEFGDIYATNHYLNLLPLQEREEWMSYWGRKGDMPYFAIELGTPDYATFMRGRKDGGFTMQPYSGGAAVSEPLMTEFCTIYVGESAYAQETEAYRALIPKRFLKPGGDTYRQAFGPERTPVDYAPAYQSVQHLFIQNTWRSWRTLGLSSMIAWGMTGPLGKGWDEGVPTDNTGVLNLGGTTPMPAFAPGRRGVWFPAIPTKKIRYVSDEKRLPAGDAIVENGQDTLTWIVGPEKNDYPATPIPEAKHALAAEPPPAYLTKDHNFLAGETLRKQAALLNEGRATADYSVTWTVECAGAIIGKGAKMGKIEPATPVFVPLEAGLPSTIPGAQADGEVKLDAEIGGVKHQDTFAFRVVAPARAAGEVALVEAKNVEAGGESLSPQLQRLGATLQPWSMKPGTPLVVASHAWDRLMPPARGTTPAEVESFVAAGGQALVLAQDPEWMRAHWGFRVNRQVSRRIFPLPTQAAWLEGIDGASLRDWRGEGLLLPPYEPVASMTAEPEYGWRWGNRGSVTSAALEKPHRSGWTPLLQGEFDMAYTPVMELRHGAGRVILCTFDFQRTASEPVADQILARLLKRLREPVEPTRQVRSLGDTRLLTATGAVFMPITNAALLDSRKELLVVGAGGDRAVAEGFAARGGRVVVLAQPEGSPLAAVEKRPAALPDATPPAWPEARGLAISDLRWKLPAPAVLLRAAPNVEIAAGGQLGRRAVGAGVILYAQLDPDRFNADQLTYFRITRWRQTRALSQILANLGATFAADVRFFKPEAESKATAPLYYPDWNPDHNTGDDPARYKRW